MNYKDIKELALYITSEGGKIKSQFKDVYYDPIKRIFLHKPVMKLADRYAQTLKNGRNKQGWITNKCVFVGRYDVDVNPKWIIEDLIDVQ